MAPPGGGVERRRVLRFEIDDYSVVLYRIGTLQRIGFRKKNIGRTVRNLSLTGACLISDKPVRIGQKVQLLLILNKFNDLFDAMGIVRWVAGSKILPDHYEIGVEFTSLEEVQSSRLQHIQGWFTSVAYRVQKELTKRK